MGRAPGGRSREQVQGHHRKEGTHQQFFPSAATVIKHNSPGATQVREPDPPRKTLPFGGLQKGPRRRRGLYQGQTRFSLPKFCTPSLPITVFQSLVN